KTEGLAARLLEVAGVCGKSMRQPTTDGRFNHDGTKKLHIRHGPMIIKLRHWDKDWTIQWELVGSSLGLRRRYREDR
ncbi:hypothetical protein GW17_00061250, partial [Ensete ventricosum]